MLAFVKSLICATVTAETTAQLRRERDEVRDADLVELRLDTVRDPSVAGALEGRRHPVVVTCRPVWEGGQFAGSEEERRRLLEEALALGAEYVDIEWRARWDDLIARENGQHIVLSMHEFDCTPADLPARLSSMRATGAGTVKIAVQAKCLADCVRLLDIAANSRSSGRTVLMAMGEHGLPTRVLAGRFGSAWTYAGPLSGIGQIPVNALMNEYRFRQITERTAVYGVAGGSAANSVSPAMHNAAFKAAGHDAVYLPLSSVSADDFMTFANAVGLSGASVTMPHKVALVKWLAGMNVMDAMDPVARQVGAVNTIRSDGDHWVATNTDVAGFLRPLRNRVSLPGLRVSILGAGGAARAVAVALASSGSVVRVHARRSEQAEEVARVTGVMTGPWPPEPGAWNLLVNCTPGAEVPLEAGPSPRWVYDLVYKPPRTRLLQAAEAAGCRTIGGLEMLIAQAEEQFTWWTGSPPPPGVMEKAAKARLAEGFSL